MRLVAFVTFGIETPVAVIVSCFVPTAARVTSVLQGLSRHSLARELTAHTPTKSN